MIKKIILFVIFNSINNFYISKKHSTKTKVILIRHKFFKNKLLQFYPSKKSIGYTKRNLFQKNFISLVHLKKLYHRIEFKIFIIIIASITGIFSYKKYSKNKEEKLIFKNIKQTIGELDFLLLKEKEDYKKLQPFGSHKSIFDDYFKDYIKNNNTLFDIYSDQLRSLKFTLKKLGIESSSEKIEALKEIINSFIEEFHQKTNLYKISIKSFDQQRILTQKTLNEQLTRKVIIPYKNELNLLNNLLQKKFINKYKSLSQQSYEKIEDQLQILETKKINIDKDINFLSEQTIIDNIVTKILDLKFNFFEIYKVLKNNPKNPLETFDSFNVNFLAPYV